MAKKKQTGAVKKTAPNLPPKIYTSEGLLSKRQFINRIKKGEKVEVRGRSKDRAKEYKKEYRNSTKELIEPEIYDKLKSKNYQRFVEGFEISQSEIANIKKQIRKKDCTFFSADYYKGLLAEAKAKEEATGQKIDEYLTEYINKEKGAIRVVYTETKGGNFHYQTGDFVDRLGNVKDEVSKGTNFYVFLENVPLIL